MKHFFKWLLSVACLLGGQTGWAAPEQAEVQLRAFKVVTSMVDGQARERLQETTQVRPGDTIEYEVTYKNNADRAAKDVAVTLPVPAAGLQYVPGSTPASTLASVDGKAFQVMPLLRTEVLPSGRTALQPVPVSEYRFMRWKLGDVPAGSAQSVRVRMLLPALVTTRVATAR